MPLTGRTRKSLRGAGSITVSRRDGSLAAIPYAAGETVLLAKTADLSVFTVAADCLVPGSGETGYCLARKNNAVFLKETGFRPDGETALFFAEWEGYKGIRGKPEAEDSGIPGNPSSGL